MDRDDKVTSDNVADKAFKEARKAVNDLRDGEFGDAAQNAGNAIAYGTQAAGRQVADAIETVTEIGDNQPAKDPADLPGE